MSVAHRRIARQSQQGATLVLYALALAVLVLMAGLALDIGHLMLSKTRLQGAVDAAALAAAKTLDESKSTTQATAAAVQAFGSNAAAAGNSEMAANYSGGNGSLKVTVEYSSTLPPFTAGSTTGPYVRVSATGFTLPAWLVQIAGTTQMTITATAVAGPSPTINTSCNPVPMLACGTASAGAANLWGYSLNGPTGLKSSAPGNSAVGPGNFQLLQFGAPGGSVVRQNLAGGYASCISTGNTVQTQTGNQTGPTAQGLNTRFGQYSGGGVSESTDPPDVITTGQSPALTLDSSGNVVQGSTVITASNIGVLFDYQDYTAQLANPASYNYQPVTSGGPGVFQRRVISVPIGDCTGTANGSSSVSVLGFGCFFLLQPVIQQGSSDYVIGQFIGNCDVQGTPGPAPASGPGPYIIQLYHDPASGDS